MDDPKATRLKIGEGELVFLLLNPRNYSDSVAALLRKMYTDETSLVYVNINKPYSTLVKKLEDEKIDTSRIYFIDMLTFMITKKREKAPNSIFTESPQSLTEAAIALVQVLPALKGRKVLILDSVSTLRVYNEAPPTKKFLHFLTSQLRRYEYTAVVLGLKDSLDPAFISQVSSFFDQTVSDEVQI